MKIASNIDALIGNTPIVVVKENGGEILIKLEGGNPGGSIKDRAALSMIDVAEKEGKLKAGYVIVEPTSGNTGIALAMIGAARGYKVIIVMPETMSEERKKLIASYGAELVLTKGELGMTGALEKAAEITRQNPKSFSPMQFSNPANPLVHEMVTAKEILEDTNGEFDAFVAGIGTGGTFTGVSKVLKEKYPHILRVAVEPDASPMLSEGRFAPHQIQGIGANFVPEILDTTLIDKIARVTNDEAKSCVCELSVKYGISVGISAGAAFSAARKLIKEGKKRVLIIAPDRAERYLSVM